MLQDITNLFFPKVCYTCQNQLDDFESYLCTTCRHSLPITNFHFNNDPTVKKVLYGRAKIENATALLRFEKKGIVQQLIHKLKYKGSGGVRYNNQVAPTASGRYTVVKLK